MQTLALEITSWLHFPFWYDIVFRNLSVLVIVITTASDSACMENYEWNVRGLNSEFAVYSSLSNRQVGVRRTRCPPPLCCGPIPPTALRGHLFLDGKHPSSASLHPHKTPTLVMMVQFAVILTDICDLTRGMPSCVRLWIRLTVCILHAYFLWWHSKLYKLNSCTI